MFKKIDDLTKLSKDMPVSKFQVKINCWDEEMTDYMQAAENKCCKFKHTHIEWSPEVGVWIRRCQLLKRVGKYIDGRVLDPRNLIRACRNRGIADHREFDRESLQAELYIYHKKLEELKARVPLLRHQHLKQRLMLAKAAKNKKAISDIKRIMRREARRKCWARTNYSSKKRNGGGAVVSVKVKLPQGVTEEYEMEDAIFAKVSTNLADRF